MLLAREIQGAGARCQWFPPFFPLSEATGEEVRLGDTFWLPGLSPPFERATWAPPGCCNGAPVERVGLDKIDRQYQRESPCFPSFRCWMRSVSSEQST